MGMTDPKEAAIQRLLAEYIRAWDADETLPDWAIERLWLLARIAIEQAVVPAVQRTIEKRSGYPAGSLTTEQVIPWDAMCAEEKP